MQRRALASAIVWVLMAPDVRAIEIDGRLRDGEWQQARHFVDFVSVQPLTREPVPEDLRVEAWLQSTESGIAVALRARHPESIPRTETRMPRDGRQSVDRANFMIDFDGDGRNAFAFTLTQAGDIIDHAIVRENVLQTDWDGDWRYAVGREDRWVVFEWLVPWTTATMQKQDGDLRDVAVYFDRYIAATGQRFAFPAAALSQPRFVSDFARIRIPQYRSQSLAVAPYVVSQQDLVGHQGDQKLGADLFWKPNASHQFAATLNPDFGQVESDDLVVNFSAIETFFTDKRPFFIDNQSAFDGAMPGASMFYTRRVGGAADDGSGASDIDAAIKASGGFGRLSYAGFAAQEDGEAGRDFALARLGYGNDQLDLRLTHTMSDRPGLAREADVTAIHARYRPQPEWLLDVASARSNLSLADEQVGGWHHGGFFTYDPAGPWRFEASASKTDAEFEINDLGYQQRNDQSSVSLALIRRNDATAETSAYASHEDTLNLQYQENGDGLALLRQIDAWRYSERRNGGSLFLRAGWRADGHDDLLSRGHGVLATQDGPVVVIERQKTRSGHWSGTASLVVEPGLVDGMNYTATVGPRFHASDRFDIELGTSLWRQDHWLLWRGQDRFADFDTRRVDLFANLNWFPGARHEWRAKLQGIAIEADGLEQFQLMPDGALQRIGSAEGFELSQLGFQLRYRYKLGHQRDLFVVYSRGGAAFDEEVRGLGQVFGDLFSLRDDSILLAKLTYRFET